MVVCPGHRSGGLLSAGVSGLIPTLRLMWEWRVSIGVISCRRLDRGCVPAEEQIDRHRHGLNGAKGETARTPIKHRSAYAVLSGAGL